jgi:PST family polysaccharide transporter
LNIVPGFIRRRIEHRPRLIQILDNIGWLAFDKALRLGLGLVVSVWIARYLGPQQFGELSYVIAFTALFGVVATFGVKDVVVRELVRHPQTADSVLGSAAVLLILSGFLAYGLTLLGIRIARPDNPTIQLATVVLGSAMLLRAADIGRFWFESQVRSKYVVWGQNLVFLVAAAVKVLLILWKAPLIAFVWVLFGELVCVAIAVLMAFNWAGPGLGFVRFDLSQAKVLARDSWPLVLSGVAIMIYMKVDQVMISHLLDDTNVGVYSAAVSVSEVWYFVPVVIASSLFPSMVTADGRDTARSRDRFQRLFDVVVLLAIGIAIPMTFFSDWLITTLFGSAYREAGTVLAIHIWASIFVFLGVASERWFVNQNRQVLSMQRTMLGAFANIALNLVLIPRYGIIGAATATVVSQALAALIYDVLRSETRPLYRMKLMALNPVGAFGRLHSESLVNTRNNSERD